MKRTGPCNNNNLPNPRFLSHQHCFPYPEIRSDGVDHWPEVLHKQHSQLEPSFLLWRVSYCWEGDIAVYLPNDPPCDTNFPQTVYCTLGSLHCCQCPYCKHTGAPVSESLPTQAQLHFQCMGGCYSGQSSLAAWQLSQMAHQSCEERFISGPCLLTNDRETSHANIAQETAVTYRTANGAN